MKGNWFTDRIPWRFFVIRRTYIRNIHIARVCPEIRGEINRNAFLLMIGLWFYLPLAVLLAPFWLIHVFCDFILELRIGRFLPDFEEMRIESVRQANAKISAEEVRRRLDTYKAKSSENTPS